jgi:PKD repeat protein
MKQWLGRLVVWVWFAGAACGSNGTVHDAASVDDDARPLSDAAALPDSAVSLSWVDFAISGCIFEDTPVTTPGMDAGPGGVDAGPGEAGDGGPASVRRCVGHAPLELGFSAVAPATIESYRWNFGDGDVVDVALPVHVYAAPGWYTVELTVGGPRGTAQTAKIDVIEVRPAPLMAVCQGDTQCEPGLACLCAEDSGCPVGLQPGRCTAVCDAGMPCAAGACVDLAASGPAAPAVWQHAICSPECTDTADCPDGLACQELLTPDDTWVRACFAPGLLRALGQSCFDGLGQPAHELCASGHCATLGARGMCASLCTPAAGSCPDSSACADFLGAEPSVCVARCPSEDACTGDPWLACQAPGATGDLGFTVDEAAAELGYCAPRTCTEDGECGDGACTGGYCGP